MSNVWMRPSGWVYNIKWGRLEYYEQKFFSTEQEMLNERDVKPTITIPRDAFFDLQEWWEGEGKNRVSSTRKDDLKLVNRLIDVIEKMVTKYETKAPTN